MGPYIPGNGFPCNRPLNIAQDSWQCRQQEWERLDGYFGQRNNVDSLLSCSDDRTKYTSHTVMKQTISLNRACFIRDVLSDDRISGAMVDPIGRFFFDILSVILYQEFTSRRHNYLSIPPPMKT